MAWVGSLISVLGTLGGVIVGHYFVDKSRREQWLLDTKKQEYRETLTALSTAYLALLELGSMTVRDGAEELKIWRTVADSYRVLRDRLFIADELKREELLSKWLEATQHFDHNKIDTTELAKRYDAINDKIVHLAASLVA